MGGGSIFLTADDDGSQPTPGGRQKAKMQYQQRQPCDNQFLARNAGLAGTVARLFRSLDMASDTQALQIIAQLRQALAAAGLSFSCLGNVIEELPFNRMAADPTTLLNLCASHHNLLSEWQQGFIKSLQDWHGEFSPKQREKLTEIAREVWFCAPGAW
jgi:hypothetical protein